MDRLAILEKENTDLRQLLFHAHGNSEHFLYGDDGERTCNSCRIDFLTDTPDQMKEKIFQHQLQQLYIKHMRELNKNDS